MKGLVIKNTGNSFVVKTVTGEKQECVVKGNFRIKALRSTNPVAIGDHVEIRQNGQDYYITEIEERKNYIVRKPTNLSKQLHILAANIDMALLIVTVNYPQTNLTFIDRFLATAEAYTIPACLIFNKKDIYNQEDTEYQEALMNLYRSIGYPCIDVSARTGENIDVLRKQIAGKICLLSGNSGVGKSSIVNALAPEIHAKVGDISAYHNQGMHTTSLSEMFELPDDVYLIDTPGIRGFQTVDMKTEEIGHYFPEIFKASSRCRYGNCTHRNEPDCAVLKAVEEQRISESRYRSYLNILEDVDEGKYRKEY